MINCLFPESFWYPRTNVEDYLHKLRTGEEYLQKQTINIVGICRNVEKVVELNIRRFIYGFMDQYMNGQVNFYIYENNSTDATKKVLKKFQTNAYMKIVCEDENDYTEIPQNKSYVRRTMLANYRNKYLSYLNDNGLLKPNGYTVVYDFDIIGGFSYEGILHSFALFKENKEINVCTSNGIIYQDNQRLFYDTWAYRPYINTVENANLVRFERGENPVPVISNFGGMAIYRNHMLKNVSYTNEDCDHVTIHKNMSGVVLNPNQIVLYSPNYYANIT